MLVGGKRSRQRGETLIELLLAFAILGMALITVMRTMNGGLSSMFVSGQRSQVESQMRGQLAILQAAHQEATKNPTAEGWGNIVSRIGGSAAHRQAAINADACTYSANKNRLYFGAADGGSWARDVAQQTGLAPTTDTPVTTSSVTPSPNGTSLWIEAKHTPKNDAAFTRGYYDFYIKACWQVSGGQPQQAKMVSRFYDIEAPTAPAFDNFLLRNVAAIGGATGTCANGNNVKIRYTLENTNSYPLGYVKVYVDNIEVSPSGGHYLGASPYHTVTAETPAGYSAGSYEVKAVSSAGTKTQTASIDECAPPPINIAGSSHTACWPLATYEGDERSSSYPPGFMNNPGPHPYPCQTYPAYGTVYACVNYDVAYNPNASAPIPPSPSLTRSGFYRATLTYLDANCGDASNQNLNVSGYEYRIEVYRIRGGVSTHVDSMSLSPGPWNPLRTATSDPIQLNPGDTIGFRWWNNRFISSGGWDWWDPDLVIRNVKLEWSN